MIKRTFYLLCLLFILTGSAFSQISLSLFSSGFASPVDIKNCGDDRLFIVEQRGTIQIVDTSGVMRPYPFLDIRSIVQYGGEQGLLGLAFPRDFLSSGYFYVYYSKKPNGYIHISRFHVNPATPDSADASSEEVLIEIYHPYANHNGGHLAFGPDDGYLYFGTGDGGSAGDPQNRAQNTDTLLGKINRIAVDPAVPGYSIPPTNPFAHDTTLGRPEIWTIGMRNPWRWSFDRMTGDLWIGDVGQDMVEEVDMQPKGSPGGMNYGWRCYEGNQSYNLSVGCGPITNYEPPIYTYTHQPVGYCSITGGYRYRGARFQELYPKYFYADYCKSYIQYLEDNGSGGYTNTNLGLQYGDTSIVAFGEDHNGEIYCSSITLGRVYHLVSANCAPVATINAGRDTVDDCGTGSVQLRVPAGTGFDYLWTHGTDTVSTIPTYVANQAGTYILHVNNNGCTNSDSVYVNLTSPLNITFAGLDTLYCIYSQPAHLSPNYLGGVFTGNGMTLATYNPSLAGVGTDTITYTYTNASGCTFSHSQEVRVDECLNVPDNKWTNTITVFPNPSNGDLYLHAYTSLEKRVKMEVNDVTGRIVKNETFAIGVGENTVPVNFDFAEGVYIIHFSDGVSSSAVRVIKQ